MVESHPGVPLIKHLRAVAKNCLNVAQRNTTDFGISQKTKEALLYICGIFHDLGKSTSYFQNYLNDPDGAHTSLKNHALPSAVFVFYVVKKYAEVLLPLEKENGFFLASLCFTVVKRHHGHLRDFQKEVSIGDKKDDLKMQFDSISPVFVQNLINECLSEYNLDIQWEEFILWFNSDGFKQDAYDAYLDFELGEFDEWEDKQKSSAYYFFLWMFGALLYSDKSDVILESFPSLPFPEFEYLNNYRIQRGFDHPETEIDELKDQAFLSVLDQLEKKFDPAQKFYSITLPTGLGTTLTSLGAALRLKKLASLQEGKIIVAIPFTSIIDQNFQVYEEVFNNPDNALLLKHHHLAEPKYKEGEDFIRNEDESHHLIETWQSAMIVTTFVQLLECLITNNKSKLLKFSSLSNSVIILDEVQQISYPLWQTIRQTFFAVTEHLNCYIILMSATQPLIFHPQKEIQELVPNYQKYFSFFNRTKLINKTAQSVPLDVFIDDVLAYAEEYPQKDILIILNTKKITLKCFTELRNRLTEDNEIRYLTTLITPYERKKIIGEIKKRDFKKRYIIVSTQLVEAGVDISMDTVFRALAPLDSIIQAAGRANRYDEKNRVSEVFLYKIDKQYDSTCRLYGKDLMLKTELVIGNKEIIEEKDYLPLIAEYFKRVNDLSSYSDKKLLKHLLSLDFEETGKFKLIEEIESESLFIALNKEAKMLWNEFVGINEDGKLSSLEKKKLFSNIKSKFYDYVINVPIPFNQTTLDLPYEPYHGFYLWEDGNSNYEIYSYDSENPKNCEGYIFNGLKSITL